jgi:hypothetical protein
MLPPLILVLWPKIWEFIASLKFRLIKSIKYYVYVLCWLTYFSPK